jgi:hypothetical protein
MQSIKNIIRDTIIKETDASIKIDDSHFFSVLIQPDNTKKLFHFVALFIALIMSIVFIVSLFVFFISDILLYKNSPKVNYAGAIVFERSCNRQSILFLFNSADMWAETGIQLQKGDEIKISVSGGFNSDVFGLMTAAKNNKKLTYPWKSVRNKDNKKDKNLDLCIYNNKNKDAYFGSVLYRIDSELGCNDYDATTKIKQVNPKEAEFEKVNHNGMLYLSVNDIYLTPPVIDSLCEINRRRCCQKDIIDSAEFQNKGGRDSMILYYVDTNKNYIIGGEKLKEYFKNNKNAFFNDNIGEVLVAIDIERKLDLFSWRSSWYRNTEAQINKALDNNSFPMNILCILKCFVCSILFLLGLILWFCCISIIPIVIILYFPYFKKVFIRFKKKKTQKCMVQLYQKCMTQLYMITTYSIKIIRQKVPVFKKVYFIIRYSIHSLIILIIYLIYLLSDVIYPLIPYICYPFSQKYYSQLKNKKK